MGEVQSRKGQEGEDIGKRSSLTSELKETPYALFSPTQVPLAPPSAVTSNDSLLSAANIRAFC